MVSQEVDVYFKDLQGIYELPLTTICLSDLRALQMFQDTLYCLSVSSYSRSGICKAHHKGMLLLVNV